MKPPRGLVLGIGLALGLAGCATMPNAATSYVASGSPTDNQVIATAVSTYLGSTLPPGRTTLMIQPVASGSSHLLDQLSTDLRAQGFGVTGPASGATGDSVRLVVASAFGGYVVRLDYGEQEAGTFFGRDVTGQLQPSSPFVVREATQ
jgi:di/tricarboxylate transporter